MRRTLLIVMVALVAASGCSSSDSNEALGEETAAMLMTAWATGDQADIDAVYAEDVRMVLDDLTLAENREEITEVITGAIGIGNTYEQVGPVSVYEAEDGDLYIASLVEIVGAGHPVGDPVVGFYRVRHGEVIRHVFMEAESY